MADVEQLLSEYIAEHREGGEADPLAYLEGLEGTEREELGELIDAYLAHSPGRPWDAEAFQGSVAERLSESLGQALAGQSGLWPVALPSLRDRAKVKRDELVEKLAAAIGAQGNEQKVGRYYHEMEHGLLPSSGVSSSVLDALAGIVGTSAEKLRQLGEPFGAGAGPAEGPVFARTALPDQSYQTADAMSAPAAPQSPGTEPELDAVDRLFLEGSD